MGDILFLAHRVPFPPNRGDKIRSANLLWKLAKIAPVHVGAFSESEEDRDGIAELEALAKSHFIAKRSKPLILAGVEAVLSGKPVSLTAFHSPKLERWVRDTISSQAIETIVVFSGQMGQYIPTDFSGRVIVDLCDVDSAKFESYAASGQRVWLNEREGRLLALEEERLARRADATVLISDNEAELFRSRLQFPSMARVKVIGNGIDAHAFDPAKVVPYQALSGAEGPTFVFTGQMDYPPNEAAALWAIAEFLPAIQQLQPMAQFHVVGRNPTKALLARDGVSGAKVWGEVPDVRPFLAAATCVVAPLTIARGVQNKVLEAMAMARPVLLTPQAATGIDAQDGRDWLVCEANAASMAARASRIIETPAVADKVGKAARQFVLENHSWDAMLSPLEALVKGKGEEARNAA
ncbi:Glycosyl transferase, group 1 [Erythrobacter sp. NAP1]|uniref:TIGR03087 family PEP-CTERM/XrtA system glycosyltransferase n=1 Tax=Erythrobacter sp. NAP1 TaxID=237727 RepID=UPI0000686B23|nr:TIGR03087 family PEP-CTERM/XrtA system glycosyltransferase [Erythrobacter sp. NAP1]EAQ30319.1 Glycosyl transferase, group 1 [Erythrobacter sp. NAP1]